MTGMRLRRQSHASSSEQKHKADRPEHPSEVTTQYAPKLCTAISDIRSSLATCRSALQPDARVHCLGAWGSWASAARKRCTTVKPLTLLLRAAVLHDPSTISTAKICYTKWTRFICGLVDQPQLRQPRELSCKKEEPRGHHSWNKCYLQ